MEFSKPVNRECPGKSEHLSNLIQNLLSTSEVLVGWICGRYAVCIFVESLPLLKFLLIFQKKLKCIES